ncbi:hypothetical protein H0H81_002062 [Sphagnurus paluster]|uniref:acylaminoacyl-peptidase n=1 Tax=Sphagnurus paluster TaxID=117069 RepID=A0A9P7GN79_9AGAR|nr:hypothetical protein H0H81_002062 [Sphagnurus paluster]
MYKLLTEIPVPSSAIFVDQDDHVRNIRRVVNNSLVVGDSSVSVSPPQDVGDEIASKYSPSRTRRAVLREIKHQNKRFVEIWKNNTLEVSMEVSDQHGSFYADEAALLYVAEENVPVASEEDPYKKFRYVPQFGEGIAGKRRPTIFILLWNKAPEDSSPTLRSLSIPSLVLFGQAIFAPHTDVIYATGYEYTSDHRLLGVKGCYNRPTGIWELTPSTLTPGESTSISCTARKLTPSHTSCRSARVFSHNNKHTLVWLSHPSGGPHVATSLVYSLDITSSPDPKDVTTPLVDAVSNPAKGEFPGLYPDYNFTASPFLRISSSMAPYMVTNSIWGSRSTVVLISTADGSVKDLTPEDGNLYSWTVLATDEHSRFVCARSTPISPNELILGQLKGSGEVVWRVLYKPTLHPNVEKELSTLRASVIAIPDRYPTEAIVIQSVVAPENVQDIRPCITSPHGGPHATTTTAFAPAVVALALQRYTISLPNYTGSLGFGESAVRALIGNCGTLDVEDCIATTRHLIKLGISVEGPGKQFVLGGSHGGFLSGHLIGQYPEMFSAAIIRNPVISAGEISTTDIPDWYFAEFGQAYPIASSRSAAEKPQEGASDAFPPIMSPEIFERVHRASPIAHVDAVRASVLLLIGAVDLRVAPTQGIEYYHALKQRAREGTRIELLIFEGDSHPLDSVETARVGAEAARDFLKWAETHVN